MKRNFKSIACAILVIAMLIPSLTACNTDKAPDGYKLVACDGDKFRLFVPKAWVENTDSGITSAYYSVDENAFVSVSVADDREGKNLTEYFEYCKGRYASELKDYVVVSESDKESLGGVKALQLIFTVSRMVSDSDVKEDIEALENVKYKYLQYFAEFDGDIYVLTFSCPEEKFDAHKDTVLGADSDDGEFAGIVPYFQFDGEPYVAEGKKYSDKVDVPNGMKLASTDERPYRFFVPETWTLDTRSRISAAYFSDKDKSNVSLQAHMSTGALADPEVFFENSEIKYKNLYGDNYTLISKVDDVKMGEYNAIRFTFTVKSGDVEYKLMQTVCAKGEMYYILTYTSTPEAFDSHLNDIEAMCTAFALR